MFLGIPRHIPSVVLFIPYQPMRAGPMGRELGGPGTGFIVKVYGWNIIERPRLGL